MRLVIIGLMMLFVVSCKQTPNKIVTMQEDVAVLASDEMGGRQTGTPGELLAAAYITERFSDIGLTPKGSEGNFTQTFSFTPRSKGKCLGKVSFTAFWSQSNVRKTLCNVCCSEQLSRSTCLPASHFI